MPEWTLFPKTSNQAGVAADGQRAYAVIEIGVTIDNPDVNRAVHRVRTIAKAAAAECAAIVVGSATRITVAVPED